MKDEEKYKEHLTQVVFNGFIKNRNSEEATESEIIQRYLAVEGCLFKQLEEKGIDEATNNMLSEDSFKTINIIRCSYNVKDLEMSKDIHEDNLRILKDLCLQMGSILGDQDLIDKSLDWSNLADYETICEIIKVVQLIKVSE